MQEGIELSAFVRQSVEDYYREKGQLPQNNAAAALPEADKILGNFVDQVTVANGAINIRFGSRINVNAKGLTLSIRPAVVAGETRVPIAWVYGYASVPQGMTAKGENRSDIPARFLPVNCRF
ncbi:MAG: pilin [Geopsychrobacter sp.]|nr:pilin [Geopsychrobacter sp.]